MKIQVTLLLIFLSVLVSKAQTADKQKLYNEILKQDSIMFAGFNQKDVNKLASFFSKDLEFFHDKSGLTGFEHNIKALSDIVNRFPDMNRQLVPGSAVVYPIPNYGAILEGKHKFCHTENSKLDCGTFKFLHIWQWKDNSWKVTRIISYDH
jgi:Domain of unknown function (DUF4440)